MTVGADNAYFYDTDELSSNLITDITQDKAGYIWISTEYGLNRFDGIRFVHYFHDDLDSTSVGSDHITSMLVDRQGVMWLTCYNYVQRYDAKTNKFVTLRKFHSLCKFTNLHMDAEGKVFANCKQGVVEILPEKHEVVLRKGLKPTKTPQLCANQIPKKNHIVDAGDHTIDFASQDIRSIFKDRYGNVWVGCYKEGLILINRDTTPFSYVGLSQMSWDNGKMLSTLLCGNDGTLYVAQVDNGIKPLNVLNSSTITRIFQLSDGSVLLGTNGDGVIRIDSKTGAHFTILNGQHVDAIAEDNKGFVYAGVYRNGDIHCFDPLTMSEHKDWGKGLSLMNPYINTMYFDSHGLLWIGHYYGFDVYDTMKHCMVNMDINPILRKCKVYSIKEYDGAMYLATSKGLFCYKLSDGSWHHYTKQDGLADDFCCAVIMDDAHHLWISTLRGLSRSTDKHSFVSFYHGNGLFSTNYLPDVCCKAPDGTLYFGNEHGYTFVNPKNLEVQEFNNGIYLTEFLLNGEKELCENGLQCAIECDYTDAITLCFSSLDYRNMDNVTIEYRITDDKWHRMSYGVSEIPFIHLPFGTHTLEVRACDMGTYSGITKITIYVAPPWYMTWWAFILYIVLIVAVCAGGLFIKRRFREIAVIKEKMQFFLKGKAFHNEEKLGAIDELQMKGNDEQLMERVMKCINEHLTEEDFNVEMLAQEVGLSRVQLHRRVKHLTGISVGEFIRNLRMKQAAKLLDKGDLSVSQVTYAVGLANPAHFSTTFKKYFGVSPTEYVQGHGGTHLDSTNN